MRVFAYAVLAGAVLFSLGEMGFLTQAADSFISFCLVLVFIAMHIDWRFKATGWRGLLAGAGLFTAAALAARGSEAWRLLAFTLIPAGVYALMPGGPGRRRVALFIPAVAFFMVAYLAVRSLPHVWWFTDRASMLVSRNAGSLIGQDYAFSATQSGFRVMLFAACWGVAGLIWAERRRAADFVVFLAMLAAVTLAVELLLTPLAIAIQHWYGGLVFLLFNPQVLYLVAALGPVAWYMRRIRGVRPDAASLAGPLLAPVALLAGFLIGFGLTLGPVPVAGKGPVLIVDEGLLNWRVPVFGFYGERAGGMFGRLPGFLAAQGYEGERVPRPITPEALAGAKALIAINLMDSFSPEEKRAVWDFVRGGGALLALGDHTGVGGIREPFNDLLEPVNIEFEFDSATFWAQGWRDALEVLPHPINAGILDSEDIQIWIGASLLVRPPGRPVLVGKYGYSDIGNEANADMSYLGDRRHNPGEKIGDLVLVAEARYGDGRVLVFGDTSPFQNGALVSSWAFVQRVFMWLTGAPRYFPLYMGLAIAAAGFVLLALASRYLGARAYAYILVAAGLAGAAAVSGHLSGLPAPPEIDLPGAVIDFSHGERFDQLTWYDDCIGGLEFNLMRNGYCPYLMRKFRERLVKDSDVLVVIAPSMPFSRAEIRTLEEFMEAGGLMILSTGYEEKDRSEPLFARLGIEIENVPLSHFDVDVFGQQVRFADAWPLKASDPGAVAVASHPDFPEPVMVFVPRGAGGALVIGDSRFLLNSNLEMMEEWYEGNMLFLREVFDRHRAGELGT
jgi:hypothetical protein